MSQEPVVIPEKIYFEIGEVCDLVGVQAHVLRYWETEFPMLSPQKNRSGQRSYRRRDVEMALRIKQLLYNEMFTIAGARKKLQTEHREGSKPKPVVVVNSDTGERIKRSVAPTLFDDQLDSQPSVASERTPSEFTGSQREALKTLATHLLELREMLNPKPPAS